MKVTSVNKDDALLAICNMTVVQNDAVEISFFEYSDQHTGHLVENEYALEPRIDGFSKDKLLVEVADFILDQCNEHTNVPVLDLTDKGDLHTKRRRITSRILNASNKISMETRLGPGHVVIAHTDVISILNRVDGSVLPSSIYKATLLLFKFIAYDKCGDRVVVMSKNESGPTYIHRLDDSMGLLVKAVNNKLFEKSVLSFFIKLS